jgi:hypothetical protein
MDIRNKDVADPLSLLSLFQSGILTASVNGVPLAKIDAESRTFEVEATGVKESGIRLSQIIELEGGGKGIKGLLSGGEFAAKQLSDNGWKLGLYDGGSEILRAGSGVSRLTGYVHFNPLKLRKILKSL